jgi:hypothetical protein
MSQSLTFFFSKRFFLEDKSKADTKSTGSVPKKAPAGVLSLAKWKLNKDRSITGFISGSKTFAEDEEITTSPIVSEVIARGEVVKTSSGSKYFLV